MASPAGANRKAANQARAAAMKDTPLRQGITRKTGRCPMGCGALIPIEVVGCKGAQRGQMDHHIMQCKGGLRPR